MSNFLTQLTSLLLIADHQASLVLHSLDSLVQVMKLTNDLASQRKLHCMWHTSSQHHKGTSAHTVCITTMLLRVAKLFEMRSLSL